MPEKMTIQNAFRCTAVSAMLLVIMALPACRSLPDYQVAPVKPPAVKPFRLSDVWLLGGPFHDAMMRDAAYLKSLEPDRLLSRFREYAGLTPKGKIYGGWEEKDISGHTLGHYLTAVAMLYAATGETWCLERVNYIVDELALCQNAWGNGFVGGFPKSQETFDAVKAGDISARGFNLNGLWVPWYTQHKLCAGLAAAYLCCGNEKVKAIMTGLTEWSWNKVGGLTDEQFEQMLRCEHGGMNEAFAEFHAITGDEKALTLAERFYHRQVLDPLVRGEDRLTGLHGNTQVPKVIGLARLYELTGKADYQKAAAFFWDRVVNHRSYANGGNTDREHFFPPKDVDQHLGVQTSETCNTYNMLRLTRKLYAMDPQCAYADYYERALYNHILASQEPEQGMMFYFCPMKSGHFKTYNTPFHSFWCCTGSGMENHVKYGDSIYFHDAENLYVNLFIPSILNFREKGIEITQSTDFPEKGLVALSINALRPTDLCLKIRRPGWAKGDVNVTVNRRRFPHETPPGEYITIPGTWKNGDRIAVQFPMPLRMEALPGHPRKAAFFCGPVLLAGGLGKAGLGDLDPQAQNHTQYDKVPTVPAPAIMTGKKNPAAVIQPTDKPLHFILKKDILKTDGQSPVKDIILKPFYQTHFERYAIYWDLVGPEK